MSQIKSYWAKGTLKTLVKWALLVPSSPPRAPPIQREARSVSGWVRMQTRSQWILKQGLSLKVNKWTSYLNNMSEKSTVPLTRLQWEYILPRLLLGFWFSKLFLSAFILYCLNLPKTVNYLGVNTDLNCTEESNSRPAVQLANSVLQMCACLLIKRQVLSSSQLSLIKK